jgi:hypothetical protein
LRGLRDSGMAAKIEPAHVSGKGAFARWSRLRHHAAHGFSDRLSNKNRHDHCQCRSSAGGIFLERVGAMLKMRYRFTDHDVAIVAKLALSRPEQPANPRRN